MTPSSKDVARAILARVRSMEALLKDEPFLSETEWLLLPIAKQEVALRRLKALRAYDELESPTSADTLRAAKEAGLAIARFYQLVAHWRAHDRSPFSLVPHQKLGMERPTRLAAEETASAISASIKSLLERDPLASTAQIISHVRQTWTGPGDLPSDTALRVFHERALRSANPTPGTLTLNLGRQAQERDVVAERFVETLVIDHTSIKRLVAEEDGLPPTITLAIDLWSGSPLGAAVIAGSAEPRGVLLALQDVNRRISLAREDDVVSQTSSQPKPKIVIATTFAKQWKYLTDALLAESYEIIERRDIFLHQGGPTRRLLGMGLGPFRLERRADRGDAFGYDPRVTAVQPLATIERMLSEAVDEMANRRVPKAAWATAIPLDVAPLMAALGEDIFTDANSPPPARSRGGRPTIKGHGDVRHLLERVAECSTPGGAANVQVRQAEDHVWHLTVAVADASVRDAAFLQLAKGAMEVSEAHSVPVVVHVDVLGAGES
ncbi:MAG TPA: hypothetical protein VFP12_10395 [Allosphingosinicella sp.]|nr:hypothetical protein [Allosphingosinicella sp.]